MKLNIQSIKLLRQNILRYLSTWWNVWLYLLLRIDSCISQIKPGAYTFKVNVISSKHELSNNYTGYRIRLSNTPSLEPRVILYNALIWRTTSNTILINSQYAILINYPVKARLGHWPSFGTAIQLSLWIRGSSQKTSVSTRNSYNS